MKVLNPHEAAVLRHDATKKFAHKSGTVCGGIEALPATLRPSSGSKLRGIGSHATGQGHFLTVRLCFMPCAISDHVCFHLRSVICHVMEVTYLAYTAQSRGK